MRIFKWFLNTVIEQARKGKSLSFMDEMVVPIFSESIWKMVLEIPAFVKLSYAEFEFRLSPFSSTTIVMWPAPLLPDSPKSFSYL